MSFLIRFLVLSCLALSVAACGDTKFNGNHGNLDDGNVVECTKNADCSSNEFCSSNGQCETKVSFDCRRDGCSAGLACNSQTGQCQAPACTPSCSSRECGSDGCGGTCGTCANDETCGNTGLCAPNGNANHCGTTGCPSGQTCNAASGACEYTTSPLGECRVFASGTSFKLFASGVSGIAAAEGGWSAPIQSSGGDAYFSTGGQSYVSFNAERADGLWAFGWDGVSPSNVTKVVGNWHLDCGAVKVNWTSGLAQPNCGSSLQVNEGCLWSSMPGKYRLVARIK